MEHGVKRTLHELHHAMTIVNRSDKSDLPICRRSKKRYECMRESSKGIKQPEFEAFLHDRLARVPFLRLYSVVAGVGE